MHGHMDVKFCELFEYFFQVIKFKISFIFNDSVHCNTTFVFPHHADWQKLPKRLPKSSDYSNVNVYPRANY